jgi:Ni,Fe-hydrogenase III component G
MLDVADLLPATRALLEARWGYLSAITGLDAGASANELEVLYHWCSGPVVLTFRLRTARDLASVPTLCEILPAASFFERELSEMFGVTVVGAPNPARLFLPDDWPSGVYPLRKDYNAGGA